MVRHPGLTVRIAHRLDGIPPTIFTTMSALAIRTGAVNLGQGFPDADGPHDTSSATTGSTWTPTPTSW